MPLTPAKARSLDRCQQTVGVYQYKYRNRLPIPENRFRIPNRSRSAGKPTCLDTGVSALRVPVVVRRSVSIYLRCFPLWAGVPESQGVGTDLSILGSVSVFRMGSWAGDWMIGLRFQRVSYPRVTRLFRRLLWKMLES